MDRRWIAPRDASAAARRRFARAPSRLASSSASAAAANAAPGNLHRTSPGIRHERVFARRAREETFQTDARRRAVFFRAKRRESRLGDGIIRRPELFAAPAFVSPQPLERRFNAASASARRIAPDTTSPIAVVVSRASRRSFRVSPVRRRRAPRPRGRGFGTFLDDDDRVVRVLASRVHHLASTHALATTLAREFASKSKRMTRNASTSWIHRNSALVRLAFLLRRRGHRREQRVSSRQTRRRLSRVARAAHLR